MKFLCIGYGNPERLDGMPDHERSELLRSCVPMVEELDRQPGVVLHEALSWDVTTIRPDHERPEISTGRPREGGAQMGSFFVIEASDLEEATRIASLHPSARLGRELGFRIEVRAVGEFRPE